MPKTKLTKPDEEKILEHGVGIMERLYSQFGSIYDQLRIKTLSMIAAQLVIVGFIFNDWNLAGTSYSVGQWIIFSLAVALQVVPLGLMMWILSPIDWLIPGSSDFYKEVNSKYDDYHEYLCQIHKDYDACIASVSAPVNKKSAAFSYVLYGLGLSVILLLVLKNGG